jgi:hypothetical protein
MPPVWTGQLRSTASQQPEINGTTTSVRPAGVVKAPRRAVHVHKEVVPSKTDAVGQHIQPILA